MVRKKHLPTRTNTKNLPQKPNAVESTSNVLDAADPNSEAAQKFELELCWCIQQLQNALKSGKLNSKQVEENTKVMNILMNNSQPIIKKRTVMRTTFGDYRAKMQAEAKKYQSVNSRMSVKPMETNNKSTFIKKSLIFSGDKDFRFNFAADKDSGIRIDPLAPMDTKEEKLEVSDVNKIISDSSEPMDKIKSESSEPMDIKQENLDFHFKPSDNNFKFNFCNGNDSNS